METQPDLPSANASQSPAPQPESPLFRYVEEIRESLDEINSVRDQTLQRSRQLIRTCAHTIRAIHRHEWTDAEALLTQASTAAKEMVTALADFPTVYHTGYTQDALKELVEANLVYAVSQKKMPPSPSDIGVVGSTYLKGMSEAATEMRRFILDLMRRGEVTEAESYLEFMDEVYSLLVTVDFPDAVTNGLRRQTDVLRTVLERTRGDLTMGIRQEEMKAALKRFEDGL
ncbi:MAG: haloacid dehalogenase [Chloroflexota bacterium]